MPRRMSIRPGIFLLVSKMRGQRQQVGNQALGKTPGITYLVVTQMAAVKVAVQNCGLAKIPYEIESSMPIVQLPNGQT